MSRQLSVSIRNQHSEIQKIWEEFESFAKAIEAYESEDYQKALQALDGGADRDIRIFEGV